MAGRGSWLKEPGKEAEKKVEAGVTAPLLSPSDGLGDSVGLILLMKANLSSKVVGNVSMRYHTMRQFKQPNNILLKRERKKIHQISYDAKVINCLLHTSSAFAVLFSIFSPDKDNEM